MARGSHALGRDDPWILLSVLMCGEGPQTLDAILGCADYINRGIPSAAQLSESFTRLSAAGLVRRRKAGFVATERARDALTKAREHSKQGIRDQLRALDALLACPCCGVRFAKPRRTVAVTEAEHRAALDAYRKRFDEA